MIHIGSHFVERLVKELPKSFFKEDDVIIKKYFDIVKDTTTANTFEGMNVSEPVNELIEPDSIIESEDSVENKISKKILKHFRK